MAIAGPIRLSWLMDYQTIERRMKSTGMICRGGFHPTTGDNLPGKTAIMIGNGGPEFWTAFSPTLSNAERAGKDPLEKWTERILSDVANELDAAVLFPFDGPPYHPFQDWAQRADAVFPSPIGPLIHPEFGLWHAYRGLLVFAPEFDLPARPATQSPCERCTDKKCLTTCPVNALGGDDGNDGRGRIINTPVCIDYLGRDDGKECMERSCVARRACPVGRDYIYSPEHANFHMKAFYGSFGPSLVNR
jgi:hypothetical protein